MADDLDILNEPMTAEAALALLPEERPTTLTRMRDAARAEASRIENSQVARMIAGLMPAPMPSQMALRDDFVGLMRLLDRILVDPALIERLKSPPKT